MDVRHLREFCNLVRTRSFTRSARAMNISQSALSKHISALEREVGAALFSRGAGRIELTDAGKVLFEGVSRALEELDRCLLRTRLTAAEPSDEEVRVGGYLQIAHINEWIYETETRAREQGHQLHVRPWAPHTIDYTPDSARDDTLDLLGRGNIDIAVLEGPQTFPEVTRFEHAVVFEEPIVFFAPQSSELATMPEVKLTDLRDKVFVGSLNYPQFQDRIREICSMRGFVPDFRLKMADSFSEFMRSDDPREVFFLSASGAARVPDPPLSPLAKLHVSDPLAFSPVYLVWRVDASQATQAFVQTALEAQERKSGTCE